MTGELYPAGARRALRAHARSRAGRHGAEAGRHRVGRDARLRRRDRRDGRSAQLQAPGARHDPARAADRRRARRPRPEGRRRATPKKARRARAVTAHAVEGRPDARRRRGARDTSPNGKGASGERERRRRRLLDARRGPRARRARRRARTDRPGDRRAVHSVELGRALQRRSASRRCASTPRRPRASRTAHDRAARRRVKWAEKEPDRRLRSAAPQKVPLTWLALGSERAGRAPGRRVLQRSRASRSRS